MGMYYYLYREYTSKFSMNKKEHTVVYEEERKINALAYIAIIHNSLTKNPAFQTYMYKYTALIKDFPSFNTI
jgi:hypothetical protein